MNQQTEVMKNQSRTATRTKRILLQLPPNQEHLIYVEPFANSRDVFFSKRRGVSEVLNDTDGDLVNLLMTVRKTPEELKSRLHLAPDQWDHAPSSADDSIDNACRFLIRAARNLGICDAAAESPLVTVGGLSCRIQSMDHLLSLLTNRLRTRLYKRVEIFCCDPLAMIHRYNDLSCLLYVTPECAQLKLRRGGSSMVCLMSPQHQKELKSLLCESRSRVILRGNPEALKDIAPADWRNQRLGKAGESPDPEIFWTNYEPRHSVYADLLRARPCL